MEKVELIVAEISYAYWVKMRRLIHIIKMGGFPDAM